MVLFVLDVEGNCYIVVVLVMGDWVGYDREIVIYEGGVYWFIIFFSGWCVYVMDEVELVVLSLSNFWEIVCDLLFEIECLGVNVVFDVNNWMIFSGVLMLFIYDGVGYWVMLNKVIVGDMVSFLF